jgi:hypothetical protein
MQHSARRNQISYQYIGTTAAAYAIGHLVDPGNGGDGPSEDLFMPDAITVNPFCGLDTIAPFVKTARDFNKGLFVLVRTSNAGSGELQDARLEDGRTWSEMLAENPSPPPHATLGPAESNFLSVTWQCGWRATFLRNCRRRSPR